MKRLSRLTSVLGFLAAGMAAVAQGQYQDITSEKARALTNDRIQSNLSDQGTGYSAGQLGMYGPYYNQLLNSQNNLNNSWQPRTGVGAERGRPSGLPGRGLPLTGEWMYAPLRITGRAPSAEDLGLTLNESGGQLLVVRVRDGSAMARAGFKAGDRIETVNATIERSPEEFRQALGALTVGKEVTFVVFRGEQSDTLKWIPQANELSLADREAAASELPLEAPNQIHFITAAQLGTGARGQAVLGVQLDPEVSDQAIVRAVMSGGPAHRAGLQPGDRICALSGLTVRSPQQLNQILAQDPPGIAVYLYVGRSLLPAAGRSDRHDELPTPAERTPAGNVPQPAKAPRPGR